MGIGDPNGRPWTRTQRLALLLGIAAAAVHLLRFQSSDYTLDDAWISFRIARSWLDGHGLTYNPGLPPVEGMTNLAWTLLSAVWIALLPNVDPIGPARVVGAVFHLGAVAWAASAARRLALREGASEGAAAAAVGVTTGLVALSGSMAYYATGGLETGMWAFLLAAAADRAIAGKGLPVGALLGLAFATRPEAGLVGPLLIGMLALGAGRREGGRALAGFALAGVAVEAWRLATYGSLVPNTFYAKLPSESDAAEYAQRWLTLAGGAGLGLLVLLPARGRPRLAALFGVALGSWLGAVLTGGDWMPGLRRLTEADLFLYVGAGAGIAVASGRTRALAGVGVAALAMSSLVGAWRGADSNAYPHRLLADIGRAAAGTPGVDCIAAADIGRLGWAFGGEIYDFAGLVDARIAHGAGVRGEKDWREDYFRERSPDLVILHVTSGLDAPPGVPIVLRTLDNPAYASVRAHGGYRAWRAVPDLPGSFTVILVRDGLTLPDMPWGPRDPALDERLGIPR